MTKAERERLAELLEAATPRPWVHCADETPPDSAIETEDGCGVANIHPHGNVNTALRRGEDFSHADARLIAAAVNALPALLAAADERDRLLEAVKCAAAEVEESLLWLRTPPIFEPGVVPQRAHIQAIDWARRAAEKALRTALGEGGG